MRLSIYFLTLVFLSSCTTIEVGREVVKVGAVVKDKVEETIIKKEPEIIEDKTIVEEQQIIILKFCLAKLGSQGGWCSVRWPEQQLVQYEVTRWLEEKVVLLCDSNHAEGHLWCCEVS